MSILSNITRVAVLAAVASVGIGNAAHAGLTCGAGVCTASPVLDTGTVNTELNSNILFPLFDSNLGTLLAVTVTITANVNIGAGAGSTVTNNNSVAQTFNAKEDSLFVLTDTTNPASALATALASVALDPLYTQHYTNLAAGATAAFGPSTATQATTLVGPLGSFQVAGGGSDTVNVTTLTTTSFQGGGGLVAGVFNTSGNLTISIEYDYKAPEPASIALMGAGLVGLGLVRRRRRRAH